MVSDTCPICRVGPFQSFSRHLSGSVGCSLAFYSGVSGPNLQESPAQPSIVASGNGTNKRQLQFKAEEELEDHGDFGGLGGDDEMESQNREACAEDQDDVTNNWRVKVMQP